MTVDLTIDASEVGHLGRSISRLPNEIKAKAMSRAMRRMGQRARTEYVRYSSKRLSVPPSLIRQVVREAMRAADIELMVRSPWIPLSRLGARQTRTGVSVRLRGSYRSAFIAKMANGHSGVMKRSGKSRLPIHELYGPNPAHDITNNGDDYLDLLSGLIERELLPRMLHELQRLIPG